MYCWTLPWQFMHNTSGCTTLLVDCTRGIVDKSTWIMQKKKISRRVQECVAIFEIISTFLSATIPPGLQVPLPGVNSALSVIYSAYNHKRALSAQLWSAASKFWHSKKKKKHDVISVNLLNRRHSSWVYHNESELKFCDWHLKTWKTACLDFYPENLLISYHIYSLSEQGGHILAKLKKIHWR